MAYEQQVRWDRPDPKAIDKMDHDRRRAMHLLEETAAIETRQHAWHEYNLWCSTLYSNRVIPGFRWGELVADQELWPADLRTEDLIYQIGEAMVSKASTSPLKPTPVPHGESYKVEQAVRELDSFLLGVFRQTKAEDTAVLAFRDAFISRLGWVRVGFDGKKKSLHVERIFFDNVIIDNRETANGAAPRTYRVRQCLPRESVEELYGVKLGKGKRYGVQRNCAEGWCILVEAWRLDGRHVVACEDQLLVDEPWKHSWAPIIPFHFDDPTYGFLSGKSGVELLVPYQVIQNELNEDIRAAQDLCCRPRLLQHAGSHIDVQHWDNEAGRFLMYSGIEPKPFEWPTAIADLYQERERNYARAYSAMGISEMFGNADMPDQVHMDSTAGLREAFNMEDRRHLRLWSRFQEFRLEIAKTILRVLREEKGADAFSTRYHPAGTGITTDVTWEAVKVLTDEEFSWTLEATPLSQMSPAARRELVRDWSSRGLLSDPEEAKRMLGTVNLEREEDLELASADDILRHLKKLESGDFEEPTELTNTTLGIRKVQSNYHRLKKYPDIKPEVLENHIAWIVKAVSIQQQAITPAQPVPFAPTQGMPGTSAATAPHTQVTNNY